MIQYQLSDGGWRKDMKNTSTTGSWGKSTIDNNATWGQIRFLASVYNATGTEKYKTACLKGIDLLIKGQYANGGWPQVFNDAGTYHAHITYNDKAMVSVMEIMLDISQKSGAFSWIDSSYQKKADKAVDKGIECFLNTQITVNGTLTAWCQQHNENTLEPDYARAYELPSVCTSESAEIVTFMRSLPDAKKSAAVIRSINAASPVSILSTGHLRSNPRFYRGLLFCSGGSSIISRCICPVHAVRRCHNFSQNHLQNCVRECVPLAAGASLTLRIIRIRRMSACVRRGMRRL